MDLENLKSIDRIRIPETRDFKNGYLMNRNERVVPWPKEVIDGVMGTIHPNEWNMYHYVQTLYTKWAKYARGRLASEEMIEAESKANEAE